MHVELIVTYMPFSGNGAVGRLQIGTNTFTGRRSTQYFEWVGPNGQDGGIWVWSIGKFGQTCMFLTSNLTRTKVGELNNHAWNNNTFPPPEPWFKPESFGPFTYIDASGKEFPCDWRIK